MTSSPSLRPYVETDWEDFLALDLETSRNALRGASEEVRDRFVARWPEFLRSRYGWTAAGPSLHASLLQICEVDGRFAGHLWLTEQTDFFTEERELFITAIAVVPQCRGRGLGRFLMESALAEARRRGLARVGLGVDASNGTAIELYESMGFTIKRLSMEAVTTVHPPSAGLTTEDR
ncbi:GNAT family N-acetyltransferase [Roseateles sp. NT4]|uniref:GNAT family N-acetyltransferase n=1 Tax=Roseateles sp. NT4 TaxID=3453715 RepID=UPI003EED6A10